MKNRMRIASLLVCLVMLGGCARGGADVLDPDAKDATPEPEQIVETEPSDEPETTEEPESTPKAASTAKPKSTPKAEAEATPAPAEDETAESGEDLLH